LGAGFFYVRKAMSRFLLIDIGAGTMDLLFYEDTGDMVYKAVARSPVRHVAQRGAQVPGNLVVTGSEMGGGDISRLLCQRARQNEVVMSASAAATIHHNPERVRTAGITIAGKEKISELQADKTYHHLVLGDLDRDRIAHIFQGWGIPFACDIIGICAQDHGVPPAGVSHLDYRHTLFRDALSPKPFADKLLYASGDIPPSLNRLRCIAEDAARLPGSEIYVMDSGMAAILGATYDPLALTKEKLLVLDIATSHTVGAAVWKGELCGFFEYHTSDMTCERLETLLIDLADGNLNHRDILAEGGHGAYVRKAFGFQAAEIIVATGPKRRLAKDSRLPIHFGAPLGDNMMTGNVGLLAAIHKKKGLAVPRWV